ncbi:MAG TPA: MFS transporter [Rhizomicrobium sp.]|nr:MFS transporter [Rhizomicrobium sp.]
MAAHPPPAVSKSLSARAIMAATAGNALEFYDFITYAFFAIQIGHAFFPKTSEFGSLMLSLATFGAGFITRPIGGLVLGFYADKVGRRAVMMLSFTMMGCAIIGIAIIPPYTAIGIAAPILAVLCRLVQGFSLGGEVGPTTAYLMEAAPLKARGLAVSWQSASQSIAATTGASIGVLLSAVMSTSALDSYGWRIAFLLGAVTLPFGLWIRRRLPETLHEEEPHAVTVTRAQTRLGAVRESWRIIMLSLVVLAGGTISTYVFDYMTTYAQSTLHFSATVGFAAGALGNLVGVGAVLWGGWLSDRIGRRPVMIWPNVAYLLMIYPLFVWIVSSGSPTVFLVVNIVLGFVSSVNAGAFYAAFAETLPKSIRGGTFATIYATSIATFGGTTQLVVTWLLKATGSPMAPAWYLLVATAAATIAMYLILESAPAQVTPHALDILPELEPAHVR